jgi:hypothetical protein
MSMATIVKAGTERVEVKQADMAGIGFVPHAIGLDEIVLLTARSTNQGSPPKGAGPLFCASSRTASNGFEIIVCSVSPNVAFDVVVTVDWAIVKV